MPRLLHWYHYFKWVLSHLIIPWGVASSLTIKKILSPCLSSVLVLLYWNFILFYRAKKRDEHAKTFQNMLEKFYTCIPAEPNVNIHLTVIYEIGFFDFADRCTFIGEFNVPEQQPIKVWSLYIGALNIPYSRFLGLEKVLRIMVEDISKNPPEKLPFAYYLDKDRYLHIVVCLQPNKTHHKIKVSLKRYGLWRTLRSGKGQDVGSFTIPASPYELTLEFKFPDKYPPEELDLKSDVSLESLEKSPGRLQWKLAFPRDPKGAERVINYTLICKSWEGHRLKVIILGLYFITRTVCEKLSRYFRDHIKSRKLRIL